MDYRAHAVISDSGQNLETHWTEEC